MQREVEAEAPALGHAVAGIQHTGRRELAHCACPAGRRRAGPRRGAARPRAARAARRRPPAAHERAPRGPRCGHRRRPPAVGRARGHVEHLAGDHVALHLAVLHRGRGLATDRGHPGGQGPAAGRPVPAAAAPATSRATSARAMVAAPYSLRIGTRGVGTTPRRRPVVMRSTRASGAPAPRRRPPRPAEAPGGSPARPTSRARSINARSGALCPLVGHHARHVGRSLRPPRCARARAGATPPPRPPSTRRSRCPRRGARRRGTPAAEVDGAVGLRDALHRHARLADGHQEHGQFGVLGHVPVGAGQVTSAHFGAVRPGAPDLGTVEHPLAVSRPG